MNRYNLCTLHIFRKSSNTKFYCLLILYASIRIKTLFIFRIYWLIATNSIFEYNLKSNKGIIVETFRSKEGLFTALSREIAFFVAKTVERRVLIKILNFLKITATCPGNIWKKSSKNNFFIDWHIYSHITPKCSTAKFK